MRRRRARTRRSTRRRPTRTASTLTLEFNRLTDDLAATRDIEAATLALYNMAVAANNAGADSPAAVNAAKQTYATAHPPPPAPSGGPSSPAPSGTAPTPSDTSS